MRLFYCLFLLFLCNPHFLFAQSIKAGQHGPGQYFIDIQPDTTIEAPWAMTPEYGMYPIDMNGDSVFDFEIHVANFGGLGSDYVRCYIEPKNNSQLAFAYNDSCFALPSGCFNPLIGVYGMARSFWYGETIDNNAHWVDSLLYLSYYSYSLNCFYCSGETFIGTDTNYLGVRVLTSTDTVYGWIKVSGVSDIACTIEAIAGESATTRIAEGEADNLPVRVFPNPASGLLRFDFGRALPANAVLRVWDNLGRMVLQQEIEANTPVFSADVDSFASGMYHFSIRVGVGETVSGKFVVRD